MMAFGRNPQHIDYISRFHLIIEKHYRKIWSNNNSLRIEITVSNHCRGAKPLSLSAEVNLVSSTLLSFFHLRGSSHWLSNEYSTSSYLIKLSCSADRSVFFGNSVTKPSNSIFVHLNDSPVVSPFSFHLQKHVLFRYSFVLEYAFFDA